MANSTCKSALRFCIRALLALPVLGLFLVACIGGVNPLAAASCSSGYTACSSSQKCCPNGYPYHCNTGSASGKCYQSVPTNPPCTYYDYCGG
jgi:hypothetical protein